MLALSSDCDGARSIDGTEFKKDEPIGVDPVSGLPIFVLNGRFGPYVQLGLKLPKEKKVRKPKKVKGVESVKKVDTLPEEIKEAPVSSSVSIPIIKPRMASIPKTMDPSKITVADAMKYLSVPRKLGLDPKTGKKSPPLSAVSDRMLFPTAISVPSKCRMISMR